MPNKLSLIVPGLCGPLPDFEAIEAEAMPLVRLLKPFGRASIPASDYSAQLVELFGLTVEHGFPHAALTALAHGIEPDEECWLHADPVNLQADMDRAVLRDSQTLDIEQHEAGQLVHELNTHFAADGMSLLLTDANNWLIRLDDCEFETTPLSHAVGRNINHLLPTGAGAAHWKRMLNESQMLLHMSEVNQAREQRGQASINSLWLWGEGVLPPPGNNDVTHVYADDAAVKGIAELNAIRYSVLTDPIVIAQAMQQTAHTVVVLDQLGGPCGYGDIRAWLAEMLDVLGDWIEPLLATAKSLDADVNIYPCNAVRYHFANNNKLNISRLMFWKRDQLGDYVDTQPGT